MPDFQAIRNGKFTKRGRTWMNIIGEKNDLSITHPKIVKDLASRLGKYLKSVGAKTPLEKSTGIARPFPDEIVKRQHKVDKM
jgi:hypothetical protein